MDVNKYGLRMWVTTDEGLKSYLQNVLAQLSGSPLSLLASFSLLPSSDFFVPLLHTCTRTNFGNSDWLQAGLVRELVLVITDLNSSEVLER